MVTMDQLVSRIIIVEDARCYINGELSNSFSFLICFEIPLKTIPERLILTLILGNFFRSRSQKQEISLVCILLQAV